MNHSDQKPTFTLEPFEDRIDILFKEIELAIKWQRPSILLAIYGSEYVQADAATTLENQLIASGRSVLHIRGRDGASLDIMQAISQAEDPENTIFFVDGLRWAARRDGWNAYRAINQTREFYVSQRIRIIFWLTEGEASNLARYAPDYWAFRHRVVEFIESPEPEQILLRALQSTWQIAGEDTDTYEDPDGKIALRYAMLEELPDNTESTGMRANLLLSLGILHWRKGELEKSMGLLLEALEISASIGERWLQAACYNAIAIVQADQGMIDEAINSYQQAIELTPNAMFPWNNLGNLYERLNRCEEAIEAFERALANNERDAMAWNGLGNVYLRQQRNAEAITAYNKAITISPDSAYPWNGLGNAFASMGDYDAAIGAYQQAVELNKDFPTPWVNLGDIFQEQGNNQDALKAFWNAVRIDSKNAQIWNSLGNAYFFSGQYEESIQAYLKAIKLNRGQEVSYRNLAVAYARIGRHDESMDYYQRAVALGDSDQKDARPQHIEHTYHELLAVDPDDPEPLDDPETEQDPADAQLDSLLAAINAELQVSPDDEELLTEEEDAENEAEAEEQPLASELEPEAETPELIPVAYPVEDLQPILSAAPELEPEAEPVADLQQTLAEAMIEEVILVPAAEEVYVAVEAAPEPEPVAELEVVASAESDIPAIETMMAAEAQPEVDSLEEQTARLSRDALVWNELGNIYFNLGEYEDAITAYKKAIELDPAFGWGYSNLALCYSLQGRPEEAGPLYKKIIALLESEEGGKISWHGTGSNRRADYNDYGSLRRIAEGLTARIEPQSSAVHEIAVDAIYTNPFQPRYEIDIEDLVESVREVGIIQPLIVTPGGIPGKYMLVAGERRLQAARRVGLSTVPAIIREVGDRERLQFSIIENIQRVALSPLELAEAYLRLSEEFQLSHDEIAARVGKPRQEIADTLQLLKLSDKAKLALIDRRISEPHARALLGLSTPLAQNVLLQRILDGALTVAQTEDLVRNSVSRKTAYLPEDFDAEPLEATRQGCAMPGAQGLETEVHHAALVARARSVLQSNPPAMVGERGYVYRHAE